MSPVIEKPTSDLAFGESAFSFLDDEGELTPQAEVISDFLTGLDFDAVFDDPRAEKFIARYTEEDDLEEDGAEGEFEVLPGAVAAQILDQQDLVNMFLSYVDTLPDDTLESQAVRASLMGLLDEKGPFKRGSFKKMAKKKIGHSKVSRMILAMLAKGVIKRKKSDPSKYDRDKGYKTGGTKAGKRGAEKFKKKNVSKIKRAAKKAKQSVEDFDPADNPLPVYGLALPVVDDETGNELSFSVGVQEGDIEFDLDEKSLKMHYPSGKMTAPKAVKKTEGSPAPKTGGVSESASLAGKLVGVGKG